MGIDLEVADKNLVFCKSALLKKGPEGKRSQTIACQEKKDGFPSVRNPKGVKSLLKDGPPVTFQQS